MFDAGHSINLSFFYLQGFEPVLCISKMIATPTTNSSSAAACHIVASCNTNTVAVCNTNVVGCMSPPKKLRLAAPSLGETVDDEIQNIDLVRVNKNWRAIPAISRWDLNP